jgi:hypothetical protein
MKSALRNDRPLSPVADHPLTSFSDDVTAVKRVIAMQGRDNFV